ncbi:RDD family protein [Nocardioides sp.]|uniref:RDD family protein n=1 Tax=Nocardioides sp. TaxID=35761 RepID=UPI003D14029C
MTNPPPPDFTKSGGSQAETVPGGLGARFSARLIDGVLLLLVNFTVVSLIVRVGFGIGPTEKISADTAAGIGAVTALVSALIYVGYFTLLESTRGQSVGKMVMRLRTVGPDGGVPTRKEALRRNLFMGYPLLAAIPGIGGLIGLGALLAGGLMIAVGISNDPVRRQGWHDRFAGGTTVIRLR